MKFSKEYFINLLKNYFKRRDFVFFLSFSMAIVAIITSFIYLITLGHLKEYTSTVFILLLLGGLFYLIFAYFRWNKIGTAILTMFSFSALIVYLATIYAWIVEQAMVNFNGKELIPIIFCAILMLLCVITANICCWLKESKVTEKVKMNRE